MNINTVVTIADETVTTIQCKFRTTKMAATTQTAQERKVQSVRNEVLFWLSEETYTFKCKKDLAATLEVRDVVIVETAFGIETAMVMKIDAESEMDPDDGIAYRWAFAKVPLDVLKELVAAEEAVILQVSTRRRAGLREKMKALLEDSSVALTIEG